MPLSRISTKLYEILGLPTNGKVRADLNEFTKKVDGNIDSNRDGRIDEKDKNGYVEPAELYEEVFNNRWKYQTQLKALYAAGLEDPFEERPEIKKFVDDLFERYWPESEIDKTIIIFRAMLPENKEFTSPKGTMFFGLLGARQKGLECDEGGLGIKPNKDHKASLRMGRGDLLPVEIISAPLNERVALCLEYSDLLASCLRAAGIKANVEYIYGHAYAVAQLGNERYKMDVPLGIFVKTNKVGLNDRQGVSRHYYNEGIAYKGQTKTEKALKCYDMAIEIDPDYSNPWINKGNILYNQGKIDEALECYETAVKIDPNDADAWNNKGDALYDLEEPGKALKCYERAIRIEPNNKMFWIKKGDILYGQGKLEESLACFIRALEIDQNDEIAFNYCINILIEQGNTFLSQYYFKKSILNK